MLRMAKLVCAGTLACLIAGTAIAQVEYTNNFKFNSGQSIQPIFEGWSRSPDGGFNMHFGYLNRNYVEQPHVPVGVNNSVTPQGPDRGQPTFFYPRTSRNLFTVSVPKGWDLKREVVWTITVNGKTEKAFGWLQPEWEIDPVGGASGGGNTSPERLKNKRPTISLEPVAPVKLPATATLIAAVADDGLPVQRPRRKPAVGQETPPTLQGGTQAPVNVPQVAGVATPPGATPPAGQEPPQGLRVSWIVWRGPMAATFEPATTQAKDGKTTTTVTFRKPGEYVLKGTVTDTLLIASQQITVVVQ